MHRIYKMSTFLWGNSLPCIPHYSLQLFHNWWILFPYRFLYICPKILNGIMVRRLSRPVHDLNPIWIKSTFYQVAGTFSVVVLLIDTFQRHLSFSMRQHSRLHFLDIEFGIHVLLYPIYRTSTLVGEAPPHVDFSAAMFYSTGSASGVKRSIFRPSHI